MKDYVSQFETYLVSLYSYVLSTFQVPINWVQIALIALAFILGWLMRRRVAPKLINIIDRSQMHFRIRQTLKNLTKLILPITAVLVLGIFLQLEKAEAFTWDMRVAGAITSLTVAWIVIRLASNLITNTFVRQTVATVAWVLAAMNIMGILDETMLALDSFGFAIGSSRITALAVIKAIMLIFALLYAAIFISTLTDRKLAQVSSLTPSSRVLISKIAKVVLITFALLVGITTAGVDLSVLAVFGGAVGLGIGFGLQKGVSNLFSGILLLMDQSIKPGDVIEIQSAAGEGSTFGWVHKMGARYTEIVTRDNKSYLIPNEDFITQQVVNWSFGNTLVRIEIKFGVSYDSDPHEVSRIAIEAAQRPDRVTDERKPVCWIEGFGESSIDFTLRFWIKDAEGGVGNIKGLVYMELWDAFKENNIRIPYPHREVYVHTREGDMQWQLSGPSKSKSE